MKVVRLHRGRARPFWHGHPLVFSGAVASVEGDPALAEPVEVHDHAGRPIGWGFYNPVSQYRVRLVAWTSEREMPRDLAGILRRRLEHANALRRAVGLPSRDTTAWRLCNSEGDGLSGLTVDVYGPAVVVMASAAWVQVYQEHVRASLHEILGHETRIRFRVSETVRAVEGLTPQPDASDPDDPVEVLENGLRFLVRIAHAQKTGFYLDQRDNRSVVRRLASGRRVLDAFCFTGGFALNAAAGAAERVLAADTSRSAIALANENARLNGLSDRIEFLAADAFGILAAPPHPFDLIVCDPPRLATSVRTLPQAVERYRHLNRAAISALSPGGFLVTCSCSAALRRDAFLEMLRDAATEASRRLSVVKVLGAAADHPVHPAFPEGEYLKCVVATVT